MVQKPRDARSMPASAKAILVAYRGATKRQLARAGSRWVREGRAHYPYELQGGTTAVAHMQARMREAFGTDGMNAWYYLALDTAFRATTARFGLPVGIRGRWPIEAQAADLALQAALLTAISREGGQPFDDDVTAFLTGRWTAAGLPL